jgi:hypothetical protein
LPVDRNDIALYLFKNCLSLLAESDINTIRSVCFDEKESLMHLVRKAEKDSDLPPEIRKALRDHFRIAEASKKRPIKDDPSSKNSNLKSSKDASSDRSA